MTIREKVCRVSDEDLRLWREVMARKSAVDDSNAVATVEEAEAAYLAHYSLAGEMVEKYGLDDMEDWNISVFTGDLYYLED